MREAIIVLFLIIGVCIAVRDTVKEGNKLDDKRNFGFFIFSFIFSIIFAKALLERPMFDFISGL